MPKVITYIFPSGNANDVCALQNVAGAGRLVLNGNLADLITNQVSFISRGYNRQISITSTNNLSGRTFTVTGTSNGVVITEDITGPNNTTVYSVLPYDVITSISVNGAVNGVRVGTGWKGFFSLINVNLYAPYVQYNLCLSQLDQTGQDHSNDFEILRCALNIYNNGYSILDNYANNFNIFSLEDSTDVQQVNYKDSILWNQFLVSVGKDATTVGYGAILNFIQNE